MISFQEAFQIVQDHTMDLGQETVALAASLWRILAEPVYADRDFPPFNRSTKDGIAINYSGMEQGETTFQIQGVQAAGTAPIPLASEQSCIEIMTGAVVPDNADTVVMYEHLEITGDI